VWYVAWGYSIPFNDVRDNIDIIDVINIKQSRTLVMNVRLPGLFLIRIVYSLEGWLKTPLG
jgi:hypothetical protein